jgi:hypothetical protein
LITAGPQDSELAQHARTLVDRTPSLVDYRHLTDDNLRFVLLRPDGYVAASGKLAAQLGHAWQQLESVVRAPKLAS